jgi:hypothetical protein
VARWAACHHQLSGATNAIGDAPPVAGDLSVCIGCALVLEFQTDLTLRVFREMDTLDEDTRTILATLQKAVRDASR